jgi:hypothetical protein
MINVKSKQVTGLLKVDTSQILWSIMIAIYFVNTILEYLQCYLVVPMYCGTFHGLIDWLINYLRFYVPLKNISLIWRRHHYRWRAAKFRPMLGVLSKKGSLSCHTCCNTGPQFFQSSRVTYQSPFTTHNRICRTYSNPDLYGVDWMVIVSFTCFGHRDQGPFCI